jgi:crossover junction endodeoxyribonuclease RuvC
VIGVDPGKGGAVALLDGHGELVGVNDMPVIANKLNPWLLSDIIEGAVDGQVGVVAVVENVHSMPGQGVASSFDFGTSFGMVLGVLAAIGIRTELAAPGVWKKAMRLTSDKETARHRAIERWPHERELFNRKKDADRAEAALLALWWINKNGGS